ncbi:hypothetical protein A3D77_02110 [Candidatus Gottesmanbacteria bacterium RIFCSPHIGHO2_02_FULL_39_11]|uniref:HEPN domain-containing protein n=1 Tax=Candidatus Gottesmanbacteria bacterium RIFCSPHIGHO2_02_FULL_39_11 TaxID=1798382 RepID=A0A1F5ZUT0_9BACT|nr:MAG: hypothetical protein A3D77_02110 [Candidatus Gottesmanbacteria bacterium RIFCSPHIGHO2_02_FULL_39_11]
MTEKELIEFWKKSAENDYKSAVVLFKGKQYHNALFFCHLTIEKMLKSVFIKKKHNAPPWIHDLEKLAKVSSVSLVPADMKEDLSEITTFNIQARYEDEKFTFYKKATEGFTIKYMKKTKEILLWLKKL